MLPEIFIGSDHRGFELKNQLVAYLSGAAEDSDESYSVSDLGPFKLDPADDYNDAAILVAQAVKEHAGSFGILICGSAHGIAIQANRFPGIRAIAAYTPELAKIGREHNDANILCLSADFIQDFDTVKQIAKDFLTTQFSGEERHICRNRRLDTLVSPNQESQA